MLSLLAGCAVPTAPGQETQPLLPRVTVSIDEQGTPSLLGFSLDLVSSLIGQDLSAFSVPPELVQQLMAANIQHLEIVLTGDDIYLFANGQPLPYLSTTEESWQTLGELAALVGLPIWSTLDSIRNNVLSQFGVQLALQFPVAAGQEPIPLRDPSTLPAVDVEAVRAAAGEPGLVMHANVEVGPDGIASVLGLPIAQIDPTLMATMMAAGIQHFQLETEPEGFYSYLNGQALPRLTWDAERVVNLLAVYEALYPTDPNASLLGVLGPAIQTSDLELTLFLPVQGDAPEVPTHPFVGSQ
jgi:hypothetical protein